MNSQWKRERLLISVCGSLALLVVASCRSQSGPPSISNSSPDTIVSSTPPFQTKEPERYRATRTVTTVDPSGAIVTTKSSIARDGEMRRHEFEVASRTITYLEITQGKFVLLSDARIYADTGGETAAGLIAGADESEVSPERLLHTEPSSTTYQKLGAEQIGARSASKYGIVVNGSNATNVSVSETLMWIDEALGMAIKSETKSFDGTRVTMELSDIALEVDRNVFQIPTDYKKVTFLELREHLRR